MSFVRPSNWNSLHELCKYAMQKLWCVTHHLHRCTPNGKHTIKVRKPQWKSQKPNNFSSTHVNTFSYRITNWLLFFWDPMNQHGQQVKKHQVLTRALNLKDSNRSHYRQDNIEWAYCFNHLAIHPSILYLLPHSLCLTLMAWELKLFYNEGFPTAYSPHYAHIHTQRDSERLLIDIVPSKVVPEKLEGGSQECVLFTGKTIQLYFIHVNTHTHKGNLWTSKVNPIQDFWPFNGNDWLCKHSPIAFKSANSIRTAIQILIWVCSAMHGLNYICMLHQNATDVNFSFPQVRGISHCFCHFTDTRVDLLMFQGREGSDRCVVVRWKRELFFQHHSQSNGHITSKYCTY